MNRKTILKVIYNNMCVINYNFFQKTLDKSNSYVYNNKAV